MGTFLKNFKNHKKLTLFKCPKFYRTNCDLLMISIFLQILLLLVTVINCSEFNLIISSTRYSVHNNHMNNIIISDSNSNNSRINLSDRSESSKPLSDIKDSSLARINSTISSIALAVSRTSRVNNNNNNNDNSLSRNSKIDDKRLIGSSNNSESQRQYSSENVNAINQSRTVLAEAVAVISTKSALNGDEAVDRSLKNENKRYHKENDKNDNTTNDDEEDDDDDDDELNSVKLKQIIMQGLGLKSLPDASKMNISQEEYENKYNEYLTRVRERKKRELLQHYSAENLDDVLNPVTLYSIRHNSTDTEIHQELTTKRKRRATSSNHDVVYVRFPIDIEKSDVPSDIEEATLRLLLNAKQQRHHPKQHHHSHHRYHNEHSKESNVEPTVQNRVVNLKVYQLIEPYGRVWLDSRTVEFNDTEEPISSRWIDLDVSKAVYSWLVTRQSNLGLEVVCDSCHHHNIFIMDDTSTNSEPDFSPVLNIVGRFGIHREKRSRQHHHFNQASRRKPRKTDCVQENNKCCRHKMEVVFSEIKGYDFIIQPKTFDAGYCRGRCPPRYNPAHQHAFFQSLIWKQDKNKVPRPCCAPSKLAELEVLHVDEKNKNKLQVSTWKDMRVQECACS